MDNFKRAGSTYKCIFFEYLFNFFVEVSVYLFGFIKNIILCISFLLCLLSFVRCLFMAGTPMSKSAVIAF
ncbi:hypothetical protein SAMN05444369_1024 [Capnocytophaga haemolytica]|jgi:hypothetical protein|uniref:Uncharacterized protein n=1 Tax=Capnocytophaga haemolytica TaxID=45243 RepID=A0AAX2GXW5_9FLAO|nr:hypothetical protein SAMN05444369_1024 [Capnocytophaga haemolytica]SNV08095.1 Uncharacterised protein [Capnocytophaga haemolytica]